MHRLIIQKPRTNNWIYVDLFSPIVPTIPTVKYVFNRKKAHTLDRQSITGKLVVFLYLCQYNYNTCLTQRLRFKDECEGIFQRYCYYRCRFFKTPIRVRNNSIAIPSLVSSYGNRLNQQWDFLRIYVYLPSMYVNVWISNRVDSRSRHLPSSYSFT